MIVSQLWWKANKCLFSCNMNSLYLVKTSGGPLLYKGVVQAYKWFIHHVIGPFPSHNDFINEFYIKYSGFELIRHLFSLEHVEPNMIASHLWWKANKWLFSCNMNSLYLGDKVKYVVWPALFLHEGGPLLYKGVVQPYKWFIHNGHIFWRMEFLVAVQLALRSCRYSPNQ
jgi:hypothetical protein